MKRLVDLSTSRVTRYAKDVVRHDDPRVAELNAIVKRDYPAPARYKQGDKYDPAKHLPPTRRRAAEVARYSLSEADIERILEAVNGLETTKFIRELMAKHSEPQQYSRPRPEDVALRAAQLQRAGKWQPYDAIAKTLDTERYSAVTPERIAATAERYMKRGIYKSYSEIEAELSK